VFQGSLWPLGELVLQTWGTFPTRSLKQGVTFSQSDLEPWSNLCSKVAGVRDTGHHTCIYVSVCVCVCVCV
jgi:hypothetical protein